MVSICKSIVTTFYWLIIFITLLAISSDSVITEPAMLLLTNEPSELYALSAKASLATFKPNFKAISIISDSAKTTNIRSLSVLASRCGYKLKFQNLLIFILCLNRIIGKSQIFLHILFAPD